MWRHFGKVLASLAATLPMVILAPVAALSQNLVLDNQTASTVGQTVTFTVSITNAPSEVTAYAFDVVFDAAVLQFQTATAVGLAANTFVGANVPAAGRLRVGGFTVTTGTPASFVPIAAGSSGSLAQITFTVLALQATTLTIENLQDDFAEPGWTPGPGQFSPDGGTFDVDDSGRSDTLTDAIMIARFLVGFPIDQVIANAVAPDCRRCSAAQIEPYLQSFE